MTVTDSVPASDPPPARPIRSREEGRWAAGYREPLNTTERLKKDDPALNVRDRLVNIYSQLGFDSIDKDDLRGRFRSMGVHTQREQGYDYIERVVRNVIKYRNHGERFAQWAIRADEADLR